MNAIHVGSGTAGYAVSFYQGSIDADPGPAVLNFNAATQGSALVQKLDGAGNLIWAKAFGGSGKAGTNGITRDAAGNIYICGAFQGTTDFDPGPGVVNRIPVGDWDGYVLKMDSLGNLLWVATIGSGGLDWVYAMDVDASGNVWATGVLQGNADADPGAGVSMIAPVGAQGAMIWRLNAAGGFVGAGMVTGTGNAVGRGIDVGATGEVVVCGQFSGQIDLDPGAGAVLRASAGLWDGFVVKMDAGGAWSWGHAFGSIYDDRVENARFGPAGSVYLAGDFQDSVDFDPSALGIRLLGAGSTYGTFLSRLDGAGNLLWAKAVEQSRIGEGPVLSVDNAGAAHVVATFWGTADLNPGDSAYFFATSAGNADAYCLKLEANGAFAWAGAIAGAGNENPHALGLAPDGAVWVGGNFDALTDFDPGSGVHSLMPTAGRLFFAHWSPCTPATRILFDTTCTSYTAYGQALTETGTYFFRRPLAGGCDSLVILHLMQFHDETHIYRAFCFPDTINAQIYTHPGLYTQVMQNVHQCDSILYYHLTGNPYYRYLSPVIACGQYTHRNQTYTGSGIFYFALPGPNGSCDTVEVLQLTLHHSSATTLVVNQCGPFSLNNTTYASSGTYLQTLVNTQGCDSVLTLQLTIDDTTYATLTDTACNNYTLNGITYSASGTYLQNLQGLSGCDSLLTLHLHLRATTADTFASTCDTFALNGQVYATTGTYTQLLTNAAGCDSTLTLHLTRLPTTASALSISTCQSYELNGQTYFSSGTYTQHLTNAAGCDSALTLTLSIFPSTSGFQIMTACDSLSLNGYTYYASGVFSQSLVNTQGCDSILNVYLTIDSLDRTITQIGALLTANQSGGTYQWLRCDPVPVPIPGASGQAIVAPGNGFYAVIVSDGICSDTSDCVQVTSVGLSSGAAIQHLQVHPNPTTGMCWVEIPESQIGQELRLIDVLGQIILHQLPAETTPQRLDLSHLPTGIYHLQIGQQVARITLSR
ncbi:MAG: T9SS type A sorting domain-containing protein [Bacteroidia bacterium]